MSEYKGSSVLVTGAQQGIGRSMVLNFAKEGADVAINWHDDEQKALGIAKEAEALGVKVELVKGDVSIVEEARNIVNQAEEKFGKIDFLINNAGISIPTTIDNENYDDYWDKTFDVLLKAQVRLIRASLPHILKSKSGRIVNIASTEGLGATPRQSPYTSAKHGVIGLTRSLAVEIGSSGITVNCICPGPIRTGMTEKIPEKDKEVYSRRRVPLKRYGEPEEVAHATLNFCLPSSSFINGAVLPVDGGLTIKRA